MRVCDFLDGWLNGVIKGSVRANTFTTYRGYIVNHINVLIGGADIADVGVEALQGFVGRLAERLSVKSVHTAFSMLSSAFGYAAEQGLIIKNPCAKVRLPRLTEKEIEVFDKAEQATLERAILAAEDKRTLSILVCLYTGLRIGELCALKWDSVDLQDRYIRIRQSMARIKNYDDGDAPKTRLVLEEPKTAKSKRLLPLPIFLCDLLAGLKRESRSAFVFSVDGVKALEPRTLQYMYQRLLERAGLRYRNFNALRHSFATRASELGVDVKTVSEALGHSNVAITLNRYTHSLLEQKRQMMRQFDGLFSQSNQNFLASDFV